MLTLFRRPQAFALLVAATLGLAAWVSAGDAHARQPAGMHPGVQAFLETHPGERVPVIFRTDGDAGALAAEVRGEGATSAESLGLIGGVAASVTADELARLSHDDDVDWIALDPVMVSSSKGFSAADLDSAYPFAAGAPGAWDAGFTGEGVTVAVIDSGIGGHRDFQGRVRSRLDFSSVSSGVMDANGHGTYVAGVIGGRGKDYAGMAPDARLLSLRVANGDGAALASDVVMALQWVVDHKDEFNIRVVNISMTSTVPDSYKLDPLDAAVEQAWRHGIVVVVSAGNFGSDDFAADHAPANDPYVITVGATDDRGTRGAADDALAGWSSRGVTVDGYAKPDVLAPGVGIVSTLAESSVLAKDHRSAVVDKKYIGLDGTSASAAIVSGVVALMLQEEPGLTPEQVKFRLTSSGFGVGASAPAVNAAAAVGSSAGGAANGDAVPSSLVDPVTGEILYDSVLWRSVLWRSVLWRSVESAVLWRR